MNESLTNAPIIVVGIMIGIDIVFRVMERLGKNKNTNTNTITKNVPRELIKQTEDTYWRLQDVYRHVRDIEKMLEKVKEKIPLGFDKIAELMQEMLLELKKISKEIKEPKSND